MKRKAVNRWPGLPERVRQAFQRAGYWKRGRPDVLAFSVEHRFLAAYVYKWVNGISMPDRDNLLLLGAALKVSPAWLLFGDEAAAIGSGFLAGSPLPIETSSALKEKRTTRRVSPRKDGTLRKVPKKMAARSLRYSGQTAARGTRCRVA